VKQVYEVLDKVKDQFLSNGITKKVSFGDNYAFDNDKTTIMPIAHMNLVDTTFNGNVITFRIVVLCLDWVNKVKVVDDDDDFFGSDNLHDVLNTQFLAITKFVNSLERGPLYEDKLRLSDDVSPTAEMFHSIGDNQLAGWGVELGIEIHNDLSIC
jgi:hypothetical protein